MNHEQEQEEAAYGQIISNNAREIFRSHDASTMGALQRSTYKYTEAGVCVSFQLHDGTYIWSGDPRAYSITEPWDHIRMIGVSSIVEGTDAEVPIVWLDLADERLCDEGGEALAVAAFDARVTEVDDLAGELWRAAHWAEAEDENEEATP